MRAERVDSLRSESLHEPLDDACELDGVTRGETRKFVRRWPPAVARRLGRRAYSAPARAAPILSAASRRDCLNR